MPTMDEVTSDRNYDPLDWIMFKKCLHNFENTSVMYIDEEGSEIPIENESQFQEAIRVAKLYRNNHLQLILSDKRVKPREVVKSPGNKVVFSFNFGKKEKTAENPNLKEKGCQSNGEAFPEWFTHYMKKFKKDLMQELKSSIQEAVAEAFAIEKIRQEAVTIVHHKNEPLKGHKKTSKKLLDKDASDLMEQREVMLLKKIDRLHMARFERLELILESKLEKLDKMTKMLSEDKTKPLEKKRNLNSFSKAELNHCASATFPRGGISIYLRPGSKFAVNLGILNDGRVPLISSQLQVFCFSQSINLDQMLISIPTLKPQQHCSVRLTGRVHNTLGGPFEIKGRVFNKFYRPVSEFFTCTIFISPDSVQPSPYCIVKESDDGVEVTADFDSCHSRRVCDYDVFASTLNLQKKVTENIGEIEQRLEAIDLQEKEITGIESDRGNLKSLPEKKEENPGKEGDAKATKIKADGEYLTDSDSELSILCTSDEEDNFIVIPMPSEDPAAPSGAPAEDSNFELKGQPNPPPEKSAAVEEPLQSETKETRAPYENSPPSPTRSRKAPLREETDRFRSKKIKSSRSTDYVFMWPSSSSHHGFTIHPETRAERRESTFTFTGEKDTKKGKKEERPKGDVPSRDAAGRIIYAVHRNGYCQPMETLLEGRESGHRYQASNEQEGEGPALNILPKALMNGASNVASLALNTAKSVINNLESAFGADGREEMEQLSQQLKKGSDSMNAMLNLYEMGFRDIRLNEKLLRIHRNHVDKVVDHLLLLQKKSRRRE